MSEDTDRMDALEIRIAQLEAVEKSQNKKIGNLFGAIMSLEKLVFSNSNRLKLARRDTLKLMDLYFKIYPERLAEAVAELEEDEAAELKANERHERNEGTLTQGVVSPV